ncbi:DUF3306 domain-containing protein [Nitrincola tapanii]|uniref:DUF3306 domain-containing protein n=1 Tax=Nitrincola tapanii TaxID=1708751 RepID=A0A5A9W2U3_9GAMM|nr:DUF3306 domain-containing protein [Nitrincola tapanii]KAA0875066.1 DUF3306 domain-containing protein [Nitrincola tapanii]
MTESFLQRWSRRKQAVKESEVLEKPLLPVEVSSESFASESSLPASGLETSGLDESALDETTVQEEEAVSRVLTDADMPDLDSLHARSDVSMFFSSGVSAELRRQALRRLFHQPEFNVRDPLDDYALDYSQPQKLVGAADQLRRWASGQMQEAMDQARASVQESCTEMLEDASGSSAKAPNQTSAPNSPQASEEPSVALDSAADESPKEVGQAAESDRPSETK